MKRKTRTYIQNYKEEKRSQGTYKRNLQTLIRKKYDHINTSIKNKSQNNAIFQCALPFRIFIHKLIRISLIFSILVFHYSIALSEEVTEQENLYIPSFRAGHNLSLFISAEYSTWILHQVTYRSNDDLTSHISHSNIIPAIFLRYSYHINIVSNFGFVIGSSTGILFDGIHYENLVPGYGIAFPTILLGLSLNVGPQIRYSAGAEYGAIWYPNMVVYTDKGINKDLGAVPDMLAVYACFEYFLTREKAILFQGGWRYIEKSILGDGQDSTFLNSFKIYNNSYFFQFGMTWQLGQI